jgi:multidrug efflux pump subunit AcrB
MHFLINWFIRNPVAANLLMFFILVAGGLSISSIRIEGFPKIPADSITISVTYMGATAEQMSEGITQKIERATQGLAGVKKVTSFSFEDLSEVTIQKQEGYDLERLLDDIKLRVESITGFPQGAQKPIITRDEFSFPAMIFQVYGNTDRDTLQKLGERARKELLAQPEISKLKLWGNRKREISVELVPEKLEALNLSIKEIAETLNNHNLQYRMGKITSNQQSINLRADHQAYQVDDFANLSIKSNADGSSILLKDIATLEDGFKEEDSVVRYQGQPAIGIEILMAQKGNIIEISQAAQRVKMLLSKTFPDNVTADIWTDQSHYIKDRLVLLQSNALYGLIIVFVLLALFLDAKIAFWVAMGVPISLAGTLAVMGLDWVAYSLNDVTTFGFIIVLGILVDDAVVVGESVYEERQRESNAFIGTQKGVERVATATTFGILTSVAAFYPLLLIGNPLGKVLASFAGVVIIALLFSLLESKFILPAHLAGLSINKRTPRHFLSKTWMKTRYLFDCSLHAANHSLYRPLLSTLLVYRYATLIVFIAAATLGIGLIYTGTIRTAFFPDIPGNFISVEMQMDAQSSYAMNQNNADVLEQNAYKLNQLLVVEGLTDTPPIEHVMTAVIGSDSAYLWAELIPDKERSTNKCLKSTSIANRWREMTGNLEGVSKLTFSGTEAIGSGGFQLMLHANDKETLDAATKTLIQTLSKYMGVNDVHNELKSGNPEIRLVLKPESRHLGITQAMLAMHIGDTYGGLEVQKILRNSNEVNIVLRYPKSWRSSLERLHRSRIQTLSGEWLPLSSVADFQAGYIPAAIMHHNAKQTAIVKANIDKDLISPAEVYAKIMQKLIPEILAQHAGLSIKPAGELEEMGKLKGGIIKALILALLLIYILLAVPLKSYWQPLIIMSVIPFGFAGAAFGHYLMGIQLSVLSFFGMMALTGIVVNDSLVMLTRFNQLREEGKPIDIALVDSGSSRFRAIFLTTVTTVGGLLPLLYETSEQAQYLIPAAVSLAYGELFATAITLILVPLLVRMGFDFIRMDSASYSSSIN